MSDDSTTTLEPKSRAGSIIANIVLVMVSVAFTFLLIEVFVRVGFDLLPPAIQGQIQAVRVVPWSEERLIQPVPFIGDSTFQARLEPGIEDREVRWHDARFTFDTGTVWDGHVIGLRTEGPEWPLDILAFGDSFTFCWTAVEDCWVQRLGSDYGWHTVNAGLPGTGSGGQLALIRDIAEPLQPGLVVWQWYPNDLLDNYHLARFNDETPALDVPPGPPPAPEPSGIARYSAVIWLLELLLSPQEDDDPYQHNQRVAVDERELLVTTSEYTTPYSLDYAAVEYGWERNLDVLTQGHEYVTEQVGAEMLFVLLPLKEEAYAEALADDLGTEYLLELAESRRMMIDLCAENGWHCIDPLPAFQTAIENGESVYYALDFHLDPSGNRILAQLIRDYVVENDLIPVRE